VTYHEGDEDDPDTEWFGNPPDGEGEDAGFRISDSPKMAALMYPDLAARFAKDAVPRKKPAKRRKKS
jgi:hypothetical protein